MIAAAAGLLVAGLPWKMDETHTEIHSKKIRKGMRLCVIADLHCREFGSNQKKIIQIIEKNHPDAILIAGDLFDVDRDYEKSFTLAKKLREWPVYYVTGNHDRYLKDEIAGLKSRLRDYGVRVLDNEAVLVKNDSDVIELCGIEDMGRKPDRSVNELNTLFQSDHYRVLLSHRPELVDFYRQINCDLIVSGHAHGGQWRIPGTKISAYAPQQGIFPKYTSGLYHLGKNNLFVSRGLASGAPYIPRLYNNPEVSFIELKPEGNE